MSDDVAFEGVSEMNGSLLVRPFPYSCFNMLMVLLIIGYRTSYNKCQQRADSRNYEAIL